MDYVAESFPAQILSGFLSGNVNLYSWQEAVVDGVAGLYSGMASPRVGVNNAREIGNASITSYPFYARLDYEGAVSGKPFYSFRGPAAAAASVDHTTVKSGNASVIFLSGATTVSLCSIQIPSPGYWHVTADVVQALIQASCPTIGGFAYAGANINLAVTGGGSSSGVNGNTQVEICPLTIPTGIYLSGVACLARAGGHLSYYMPSVSGAILQLNATLQTFNPGYVSLLKNGCSVNGATLMAFRVAD